MKKFNFKSAFAEANTLYGTSLDLEEFEDLALTGWNLIGNKQTRLYRLKTSTENRRIYIPCNMISIEAVLTPTVDAKLSSPYSSTPLVENQFAEDYAEGFKKDKSPFYEKGHLVKYRIEGDFMVFDRDYSNITILYHGIIADEDGLPYLNSKEVHALAAYCAYASTYREALIKKDANLIQLASVLKVDWIRACQDARVPEYMSQNDLDDILDVKTR